MMRRDELVSAEELVSQCVMALPTRELMTLADLAHGVISTGVGSVIDAVESAPQDQNAAVAQNINSPGSAAYAAKSGTP